MNPNEKSEQEKLDEALYQACAKGTPEEVRALLALGANPNAPHWDRSYLPEDYYCIHEAALNPDIGVLEALVEAGVDPNQTEYWNRQALAYAGRSNSLEMVKRLVELGNDPSGCDDDGGSVLSWSALNPDLRVVEFLLERGAELDYAAETELARALREGTPERVRFFLERGGDTKYIWTESLKDVPLENLRVLLEHGYDPDPPADNMRGGEGRLVDVLDPERRALFSEFADRRVKTGNKVAE